MAVGGFEEGNLRRRDMLIRTDIEPVEQSEIFIISQKTGRCWVTVGFQ